MREIRFLTQNHQQDMNTSIQSHKTTGWLAATVLVLGLTSPAFAAKGGKGGGGNGGGEEPPAVELVPAPVEYHVTTVEWDEPTEYFDLFDVNHEGYAVGWCRPVSTGNNIAIMADLQGNVWDLNDVFAPSLQANFPGWRLNHARAINAANEVVGLLVPDADAGAWIETSTEYKVVIGNIFDPESLTTVGHFVNGPGSWELMNEGIKDLNEEGDVLLFLSLDGVESYFVFHAEPNIPEATEVQVPNQARIVGSPAALNSAGQVLYATANRRNWSIYLDSLFDETLTEILRPRYLLPFGLSEDGAIYVEDSGLKRRSATGEWTTVAPQGAGPYFIVSKAPSEEEVVMEVGGDLVVYQHGFGAYAVPVTSGTPEALTEWQENVANDMIYAHGISRPSAGTDSGYICGQYDRYGDNSGFILTAIPVTQP